MLWLAASTAGAASLGRIVVHSAIGEPFRADIEILALQEGAASPALRIAAAEAYALNQLQYPAELIGARIQFVRKASGANVAEVVGMRAVLEPYLQLMVEMDLDGVRIMRAYTLLLDPPGSAALPQGSQMVAAAAAPAGVVTTAKVAAPPASVKAQSRLRAAPAANKIAANKATTPAAPRLAAPAMPQAGAVRPAAMAVDAGPDRELKRLESLVVADRKTIADMLERVAVMERTVAEMQRRLKAMPQPAAELRGADKVAAVPAPSADKAVAGAADKPAEAPAAKDAAQPVAAPAAPAPAVQAHAAPAREPASAAAQAQERHRRSEDLSGIMLLVLGSGLVGMVVWLVYVMWGRPKLKAKSGAADSAEA